MEIPKCRVKEEEEEPGVASEVGGKTQSIQKPRCEVKKTFLEGRRGLGF